MEPLLSGSQKSSSSLTRRSSPARPAPAPDELSTAATIPISNVSSEDRHHGRSSINEFLIRAQTISTPTKFLALVAVGVILGSALPKDQNLPTPSVRYASSIIGYIYFLCWSISFYPQVILNYTRKTTSGLSADFAILNVVGFGCYAIYACSFFFSTEIQKEYQARFDDKENSVQSNDVAFAFHAVLLSSVQMWQVIHYDTTFSCWKKLFGPTRFFLVFCGLLCSVYGILVAKGYKGLQWIDYLYMLSSIKLTITIIKYIPQVLLNYQRKSTDGWNVWNVLLDFGGGTLSLAQLFMDAFDMNDFGAITGNFIKFGLGLVSILFDVVFIVQHYILYPTISGDYNQLEGISDAVV